MSAVVVSKSDEDESMDESCSVAISIAGKKVGYFVMVPRDDMSFERIRHEISSCGIPVPKPFRFTLRAGGEPLSKEEEDNWSDWGAFKMEGESYFENEYHVFVEEGDATRINHVNVSRRPHGPVYHLLHGGQPHQSDSKRQKTDQHDTTVSSSATSSNTRDYIWNESLLEYLVGELRDAEADNNQNDALPNTNEANVRENIGDLILDEDFPRELTPRLQNPGPPLFMMPQGLHYPPWVSEITPFVLERLNSKDPDK